MTKRKVIIKTINDYAKANGLGVTFSEGANHTKVVLGERRTVIGRHAEINELTAKAIYKQLGMN